MMEKVFFLLFQVLEGGAYIMEGDRSKMDVLLVARTLIKFIIMYLLLLLDIECDAMWYYYQSTNNF